MICRLHKINKRTAEYKNKRGEAAVASPQIEIGDPSAVTGLRMTGLLGLDSSDVGLAVLDERIAVDVGSYLLKESLDVS